MGGQGLPVHSDELFCADAIASLLSCRSNCCPVLNLKFLFFWVKTPNKVFLFVAFWGKMADKPRRSSRQGKGKRRRSGTFQAWSDINEDTLQETEDEQEENPLFPGMAMDIPQGDEAKHSIGDDVLGDADEDEDEDEDDPDDDPEEKGGSRR